MLISDFMTHKDNPLLTEDAEGALSTCAKIKSMLVVCSNYSRHKPSQPPQQKSTLLQSNAAVTGKSIKAQ